jgi:hypothetical protein
MPGIATLHWQWNALPTRQTVKVRQQYAGRTFESIWSNTGYTGRTKCAYKKNGYLLKVQHANPRFGRTEIAGQYSRLWPRRAHLQRLLVRITLWVYVRDISNVPFAEVLR